MDMHTKCWNSIASRPILGTVLSYIHDDQNTINKQPFYFSQEPVILSDYDIKNDRVVMVLRDIFNTNLILMLITAFTVDMSILYHNYIL